MTVAKIEISVGSITFSGEATEEWLEKQLDKLLKSAPTLAAMTPPTPPAAPSDGGHGGGTPHAVGPLATFLQKKSATTNQVKKFLATAEWLHLKGARRLVTADVSKALSEANQKRLGNPSDTLNQNVAKGHVEKEGKQFYVTSEGRTDLG